MIIKSELKNTLTNLGLDEQEFDMLKGKMLYTVTDIQAKKTALESQISTLQNQLELTNQELQKTLITVNKLLEPENTV